MNALHPIMAQALRPFMPPYPLKATEAELQAADLEIARWKGAHHALNDARALWLQQAEQRRQDWSATI